MAAITTTGTLTAGNSQTFALAPGSALTLTLLPNCRVTVTETPETVSASDAGGNSPRTHNHQLAGVFTYGPYAMGGSVVVDNASNSGSTVTWGRKDTAVTTDSTGTSLVSGDGTWPLLLPQANTVYLAGDSFTANSLITTSNNFINRASEGWFNWFDSFLGCPFNVMGLTAVGGKTCRQMIDEQFPTIFALTTKPKYVCFTAGLNDIYVGLVTAAEAYARIVEAVQALMARGITPIWGTIFPKAYDSVATPKAMQCNDLLRLYAQQTNCGIFIDFAAIMTDPTSANNEGRTLASYYYDSATHPNNLFAMLIGQWAAVQVSARFPQFNLFTVGNENLTFSGASGNLLLEPSFIATSGTAGSNVSGTVPTSWTVDWATRTGTPTAAAAIVSLTDPTTGLQIANGIQLTISGSAANNDVLRVTQTNSDNSGLTSNLSVGSVIQGEGIFKIATGANISEVAMRVQTGTNESTWAGVNSQTAVALPATVPACGRRTQPLTVLATSAARYDWRIKFNGAGTNSVITVWKPRFRKVS